MTGIERLCGLANASPTGLGCWSPLVDAELNLALAESRTHTAGERCAFTCRVRCSVSRPYGTDHEGMITVIELGPSAFATVTEKVPAPNLDVPDKSLFCCNLFNFMDLRHLICLISLPCAIIT